MRIYVLFGRFREIQVIFWPLYHVVSRLFKSSHNCSSAREQGHWEGLGRGWEVTSLFIFFFSTLYSSAVSAWWSHILFKHHHLQFLLHLSCTIPFSSQITLQSLIFRSIRLSVTSSRPFVSSNPSFCSQSLRFPYFWHFSFATHKSCSGQESCHVTCSFQHGVCVVPRAALRPGNFYFFLRFSFGRGIRDINKKG